jgi:hypothetical protein
MRNDFDGDGRSDILWRKADGTVANWLGDEDGGFTVNATSEIASSNYWQIAGTGDFNDDGYDDVLWRGENGEIGTWQANADGAFSYNAIAGIVAASADWQIVGVGDFDDDGRDDILWRNSVGDVGTWLGTMGGGFSYNSAAGTMASSYLWHVVGVGDFNGDGHDDILWRSDSGEIGNWLGTANGGFTRNVANVVTVSTDWHVVAVGDYDGDGRADILWRNDSGALTEWLGLANGGFASNHASAGTYVPTNWHVQPQDSGPTAMHFLEGGTGNDTLVGSEGADVLIGYEGDDTLTGRSGNDELNGWSGTDIVDGGQGNDIIYSWASSENDTLTGGTGADMFHFHAHASGRVTGDTPGIAATITDFVSGVDTLQLLFTGSSTSDGEVHWLGEGEFTGQNRVEARHVNGLLEFDSDGDRTADISIMIAAPVAPTDISFVVDYWGY